MRVKVSYLPCPRCGQPHDRREACATDRVGHTEEVSPATIRNRARRRRGAKFTFRLTREQRKAIFEGTMPRITVPHGKSPFEPGDIYKIPGSSRLWLGFTGIEEGKDEDALLYKLYDDQPRLLRASPHGVDFDAIRRSFDQRGQPGPLRDAAAIAQAAEESGYTTSPGAALRLEREAVSRTVQEELSKESKEDRRMRRQQAIVRIEAELEWIESDPDFAGQTSDTRYFRRKIEHWRAEDEAEAKRDAA